jgi:hypothetical protein
MTQRHVHAAMAVLITSPGGGTLDATLRAAMVPGVHTHAVSKILRTSPLITRTSDGVLNHVWHAALQRLRAHDAAVQIQSWACATNVASPAEFARFVRANPTACKVVAMSDGTVRPATTLNAHNSVSMVRALKSAGLAGVPRTTLIAEYHEAYTDLLALELAGHIYSSPERVWFLGPVVKLLEVN